MCEYKMRLANCDLPRRNDLDGLLQPDRLRARILQWRKKKSAPDNCRGTRSAFSRPYSIGVNCLAVRRLLRPARASGRPAAWFPLF